MFMNDHPYSGKLTGVLDVEATVRSQSLRDDQERVSKCLDSHPWLSLDLLAHVLTDEVCVTGDLECAGSGNYRAVDNHVVDTSETVTDGILDLIDGVCVGAFDHDGNGLGLFNILLYQQLDGALPVIWEIWAYDESVLLLSKGVFVNLSSPTQNLW